MALKQGGFVFKDTPTGAAVYQRGRKIGEIVTMREASGRHCFRLGFDKRKVPRTYRGRMKAAEALKIIDGLKQQAKKQKWQAEQLIINAWDTKPQSVATQSR